MINQQQKVCPRCSQVQNAHAVTCHNCGHQFSTPAQNLQPRATNPTMMFAATPMQSDGTALAVASLVLAILSFFSIGFVEVNQNLAFAMVFALSITALCLGLKSLRTNARTLALSGVIASLVLLGIFALALVAVGFQKLTEKKAQQEQQSQRAQSLTDPQTTNPFQERNGMQLLNRQSYGGHSREVYRDQNGTIWTRNDDGPLEMSVAGY